MNQAVDTSVVLRLLVGEPLAQAETAKSFVEQADSPVHVDALVVGESYYALRHHYRVPHRDAVEALLALLSSERLMTSMVVRHALLGALAGEEPGVTDRLILAAARADDRELITFDQWLAKLDGARLLR